MKAHLDEVHGAVAEDEEMKCLSKEEEEEMKDAIREKRAVKRTGM